MASTSTALPPLPGDIGPTPMSGPAGASPATASRSTALASPTGSTPSPSCPDADEAARTQPAGPQEIRRHYLNQRVAATAPERDDGAASPRQGRWTAGLREAEARPVG